MRFGLKSYRIRYFCLGPQRRPNKNYFQAILEQTSSALIWLMNCSNPSPDVKLLAA